MNCNGTNRDVMNSGNSPQSQHPTWDTTPGANFLGIDGAKGGWVVATLNHGQVALNLYRTISEVPLSPNCRALIDMPIGLPSHHRRQCDADARKLLGPRRSTIFPVPTRAAVFATSYAESCAINEPLQGCKLSKQAWNLFPKIRELDLYLRSDLTRHTFIAEGHPELAFLALRGASSPLPPKRTALGMNARRETLTFLGPHIETLLRDFVISNSKDVDYTDAYDALSLCALLARAKGKVSFVGDGSVDEYGAPERICFA